MARHRRFHRVRHAAASAATGWKGTAFGVGAGAATGLASGYVVAAVPILATAGWWAMPAALGIAGHFLRRKNPAIGGALIGIAGYQGYANYMAANPGKGGATTQGFTDAGYMDAGQLVTPGGGASQYNENANTGSAYRTSNAGMLMNNEVMGMGGDAGRVYDAEGLES